MKTRLRLLLALFAVLVPLSISVAPAHASCLIVPRSLAFIDCR